MIRSVPYISKPPLGAQLNRSHPLVPVAGGVWTFGEFGGAYINESISSLRSISAIGENGAWVAKGLSFSPATSSTTQGIPTVRATPAITAGTLFFAVDLSMQLNTTAFEVLGGICTSGFDDFRFFIRKTNAGNLVATIKTSTTSTITLATGYTALQAVRSLALTYDGATFRGYVNGIFVSSAAKTGTIATGVLSVAAQAGRSTQSMTSIFSAALLDTRRALSASEIASLHANPYQMFSRPVRWGYVASGGGTTYTETLYDSATAAISLTDIAARVESLLSTLQSSDSLTDAVTSVETLLTSATGTGSVVDDLLSSLTEIISDSATVQVSASDVVTAVESLQSTAQSASAISEIATSVESLLTTVQTLATVTDDLISGAVETILDSASVSATATDVQAMVETVLVMVSTGSTLAELGAFIEGVLTTAAGAGSVADVIIEYVDHLIMSEGFVFLPEQRGFVFLPEQRGFVFLPEQRGFVFDKRG